MLGIRYKVMASRASEVSDEKNPRRLVRELAARKASEVAGRLKKSACLVVGADTVVYLKGEIIGKPTSPKHARDILKSLSGSVSRVYTGVAVLDTATGKMKIGSALSEVTMRRLTPSEINSASRRHLDKAGAYAVQEKNDAFVKKIKGDYYNVVGLPAGLLLSILGSFGVVLSPSRKP